MRNALRRLLLLLGALAAAAPLPAQVTPTSPDRQVQDAAAAANAEDARAAADAAAAAQGPELPVPEMRFVGADTLDEDLLARAVADSLSDFALAKRRRAALDDAAYALELLYHAQGFAFVTVAVSATDVPAIPPAAPPGTPPATPPVTPPIAPSAAPPAAVKPGIVTFTIVEGPRTLLTAVSFEGNRAFSDAELQELFRDRDRGLLASGLRWYSEDAVDDGISTISAVYWSEGYLQAVIDPPVVTLSADRLTATVAITLHEGLGYKLRRAEFTGPRVFPEDELRAQVSDFIGRPYFPQVAFAARARLLEFYGARGYAEASIDFEEVRDDATGDVGLLFRIVSGDRLTVSAIRLEGLQRTQASFLLHRLAFEPGDIWSTAAQRESYTALHRSGLFDSISIELQEGREDAREVAVSVSERPPREYYIEPGYGSYEQFRLTVGYRDRNVGGEGRIFHAEGSVSVLAQAALVGITDPWFGKDLTADVSVFANHREEPSFTNNNLGIAATLDKLLTPRWQTQFGYLFRRSTISQVDVVTADVQNAIDNVDISSFSVSPIYDSRDDPFAPTTGQYWRTTVEYGSSAIGSQLDFLRGGWTHSAFTPLGPDTVLAGSFRTGVIAPIAATDTIPLQERYFNGGENTVRSFREDELGPKDSDGNPIGGEAYSVLSAELRHSVKGPFGVALFVDVGNVQEKVNEYFRFDDRGSAVGAGLRYMLPIGPVRLDVGVNPDPGQDDDSWVAHLSVGAPF